MKGCQILAKIDLLTWGVIGTTIGAGLYFYDKGHLDDIIPDIFDFDGEPEPEPEPQTPTPTPGSGTYTYWAKRKMQCRDNHLSVDYLTGIGIKALNWRLHDDGRIFPAVCGGPSSLTILVALDAQDTGSAAKLAQLGFIQYFAPVPNNPTTQIPAPPLANVARASMTINNVGESPGHRAYKVNVHGSR